MCEHVTNISVYETAQKVYLVGEDREQEDCWRLLKIDRTNSPTAEDLLVVEDPTLYSYRELQSLLRCLHAGNLASGGLRKIAGPCVALIGACFSWSASPYLLLVTKARVLGHVGGDNTIYGIDATSLISLGLPAESDPLPEAVAAGEARSRRLLSLVDLTKDFFFSFSWPIWNTVQRTFAPSDSIESTDLEDFSSDRVWNAHLTSKLRSALSGDGGGHHSRWVTALVHGFFEQKQLSLLGIGRPLLLTLVARRSCRFAGTRYRKRGVTDDGAVANDVEIEQILELIESVDNNNSNDTIPKMSSMVQVRGSVPLFWSQTWDTSTAAATAALRPSIRMLHHLDPLYTATRKHFDDLRKRYYGLENGGTIHCLDLLRHGDSRQQESVLSAEYKNAVMFLNKRSPLQRVGYVHWDLRKHAKKLGSSLLVDLQKVQAPLLANTGVFSTTTTTTFISSSRHRYHRQQEEPLQQQQLQRGLVRTNCVDCLDRTNVAQFTFGLLAIGQQLFSLGLAPSATIPIDPGSSLAAELVIIYESMGHALAQQYGGSEAHTGFFKQHTTQRRGTGDSSTGSIAGDWQQNLHLQGRDLLTSIKRFYSNAVTDEDKQAAINLFLGTFSPAMAAAETAKWGGWLRGRAASATELGSGSGIGGDSSGNSAVNTPGSNLLLAPEPSLEDTATTVTTNMNNSDIMNASSLSGGSPPATPLPSSLSTASLASELDGGGDISLSLPEIISSALVPSNEATFSSGGGGGGQQQQRQLAEQPQQQQQRKRWPPRPPARNYSTPLLSSTGIGCSSSSSNLTTGGLQSFDAMLMPRDVRHVQLYSQHPPKASTAGGPPNVPNSQIVRNNSTGNAPKLALEPQQQQRAGAGAGFVNTSRSARDLRGNLVILPPGETQYTHSSSKNASVLPHGTSGYHTLAGLNLEGAPELLPNLSTPYPTTFNRPATAGNNPMPRAKHVSFASLSALRQFVRGGGGGGSDGGGGGSTRSESGAASGYISRADSRSASALNLDTLPAVYTNNNNTSSSNTGTTTTSTDFSWMYTQHQAVAHGLDDLGLPAQVAPLYRRGSNIVSCFVDMAKQAAEEQAMAMAKLAMPLDPAQHRAAEREVASLLRPDVVVALPEKAC